MSRVIGASPPQLDFCGTQQPVGSPASSVTQLQTLITAETTEEKNVILINHSFGGAVGCAAVKGSSQKHPVEQNDASGKVIGIVQICEAMVAAAKEAGASVETQYLDSGHVPFLGKADETPDFIQRALESFR
ncbi:hypothetical protein ETB97_003564 [Aspergillus alliaceus]|uniref:AB hydrolase-1 domain-containing protein n=1 Tax=Petromyces alliaceus TaxID=209559 RepID=A0A8H6E4A6_PETAA|nr:hypothetical protein ETB97_003564 [Aspergillus burnettii]